jgi:rhodanese-related sulfurtransferase
LAPNDSPSILFSPQTLVLDIRPPSQYAEARVPSAYSVPVPSTLLRRPAFTIAKLLDMVSPSARAAISRWQEMRHIVLIDTDSVSTGGVLDGLAGKFERENFQGTVWYVRGGHTALDGVPKVHDRMVSDPVEGEEDMGVASPPSSGGGLKLDMGELTGGQADGRLGSWFSTLVVQR